MTLKCFAHIALDVKPGKYDVTHEGWRIHHNVSRSNQYLSGLLLVMKTNRIENCLQGLDEVVSTGALERGYNRSGISNVSCT